MDFVVEKRIKDSDLLWGAGTDTYKSAASCFEIKLQKWSKTNATKASLAYLIVGQL